MTSNAPNNNTKPKTPSRLVHSIASGLKKGTKIFKKGSKGKEGNNNAFGQRRRRLRSKRNRISDKIEESGSFSTPDREREHSMHASARSMDGVNLLSSRSKIPSGRHLLRGPSYEEEDEEKDLQARVLNSFEKSLRVFLVYIGVYLFGAYQPFTMLSKELVFLLWHYLLIIWGTCVFIKLLTYYVALQQEKETEKELIYNTIVEDAIISDAEEEEEMVHLRLLEEKDVLEDHLLQEEQNEASKMTEVNIAASPPVEIIDQETFTDKEADDSEHSIGSENEEIMEQDWSQVDIITRNDSPQNHPDLEDIFFIEKASNTRLRPNGQPISIENELFTGHLMLMFRTSDADQKEAPLDTKGSASNDIISEYFRTKKRRFEIQLQFRLKKIPDSPMYLCLELEESFKLGLIQRAFVNATLNFVKQKNPCFSYNLCGDDHVSEEDKALGRYEKPRLSFPVEESINRLVVTKLGEVPPRLGEEIIEDPESKEMRMKGITYSLNDTYTFSTCSAYIDFPNWKVMNLPAVKPFSIANVNDSQPVLFRFYALSTSAQAHLQCDMKSALDIEINHRQATTIGHVMKKWIKKRQADLVSDPLNSAIKKPNSNDFVLQDHTVQNIELSYDYVYSTDLEEVMPYEADIDVNVDPPSDSDLDIIDDIDGIDERQIFNPSVAKSPFTQVDSSGIFAPTEVQSYNIDTPAWIEMMHRKKRMLQRVYVVRMRKAQRYSDLHGPDSNEDNSKPSFYRLRTGKELGLLVHLGFELGMDNTKSMDGIASIHTMDVKTTKRRGKKQGDHHVAINKALKQNMKQKSPKNTRSAKFDLFKEDNRRVAAEMKPADQSCITLSIILANLSKLSKTLTNVAESLSNEMSPSSELDSWFLSGNIDELGVVPMVVTKGEQAVSDFVLARCLWESHWREEACIIYEDRIEFFSPLAKKPCCSTTFHDIKEIRSLSDEYSTSPLLLPQLVIVTHWKCHYLAFCNEQMRSNFHGSLNSAIFSNSSNFAEQNEWQAHFWQGFNFMAGMNNTSKWDKIIVSNKQQHRLVLNSRRMSFDCDRFLDVCDYGHINEISAFVEDLLNMSLSFTSENLETSPEEFIKFQDKTSRLKNLPVQKLDRSKVETFCIWVNLYHCLLQHSLLLSSRAPTKKTILLFSRTRCYEIGGDIFSLAEIECCVIRGNMSKGINVKAPLVRAPKKSRSHFRYALYYIDSRINFVLNTGLKLKPREIPILLPDKLEEQLVSLSTQFLRQNISVDHAKKVITFPKICEVYRKDFGVNSDVVTKYFMEYLNDEDQSSLIDLGNGNMMIKYDPCPDRFYSSLRLRKM